MKIWVGPLSLVVALCAAGCGGKDGSNGVELPSPPQNLIQNGSFELGVNPPNTDGRELNAGSLEVTGWVVLANNIDWLGPTRWVAAEGGHCLDLNGSLPGGIAQTFATVPGKSYKLMFALAGDPEHGPRTTVVDVTVSDQNMRFVQSVTTQNTDSFMGWSTRIVTFTALSSKTTLSFLSRDTDWPDTGPTIDDVRVFQVN